MSSGFFSQTPAQGKWLNLVSSLTSYIPAKVCLPLDELKELCIDAKRTLCVEPNMLSLAVEAGSPWILVGDVHGQFHDMLYHITSLQTAKPTDAPDRTFLFLGDYVDRGPQGVEVMALILALKIEFPNRIYLLRGNHEESHTSRLYGFLGECRAKYGDMTAWQAFNEVFSEIPLAALVKLLSIDGSVKRQIFCTHGGLSPALDTLDAMPFICRQEYGLNFGDGNTDIVDGLLWSDPADMDGFLQNERGCGYSFGPDETTQFCDENKIDFICRAHQMVQQGFFWSHNKRVLTVFSAPNYCNMGGNKGAVMLLCGTEDGNGAIDFHAFDTAPPRDGITSTPIGQSPAGSPSMPHKKYFEEENDEAGVEASNKISTNGPEGAESGNVAGGESS